MPDGRITVLSFQQPHRRRQKWRYRRKPHAFRHRRRARRPLRPQPYRVSEFGAAYVAAISVCVTASGVVVQSGEAAVLPIIGVVYLGCGIALSRFLHHRVRWLRWKASVAVVAHVKLRTIVGWPVSLPVFIAQLCVAKHL